MGGTCSCENSSNYYNVDTYHSYISKTPISDRPKHDLFEEKSNRMNKIEGILKNNMAIKIQKNFRKYLKYKAKSGRKINAKNYGSPSDISVSAISESRSKLGENKYTTFNHDELNNLKNINNLARNKSTIIFTAGEEKLKFCDDLKYARYIGRILNNKKEGYGRLIMKNSTQFIGIFTNDKPQGFSQVNTINNEIFMGEVVNFVANGYGIYVMNKAVEYVGYWKDNQKHGYGKNINILLKELKLVTITLYIPEIM
jgi:hypothetical protein